MGRPKIYNEDLRNRLLDETVDAMSSNGGKVVSIRTITNRAGTSTNAVYTFFGSKEAMMTEAILRALDQNLTMLNDTCCFEDIETEMVRITREARSFALKKPHIFQGAFEALAKTRAAETRGERVNNGDPEICERMFHPFLSVCAKLAETRPEIGIDPERMATALWSALHGYVTLEATGVLPCSTEDADEVFDELICTLYRGWVCVVS